MHVFGNGRHHLRVREAWRERAFTLAYNRAAIARGFIVEANEASVQRAAQSSPVISSNIEIMASTDGVVGLVIAEQRFLLLQRGLAKQVTHKLRPQLLATALSLETRSITMHSAHSFSGLACTVVLTQQRSLLAFVLDALVVCSAAELGQLQVCNRFMLFFLQVLKALCQRQLRPAPTNVELAVAALHSGGARNEGGGRGKKKGWRWGGKRHAVRGTRHTGEDWKGERG